MTNAEKIATQIADTFNSRLSEATRNDHRYATYAEDIRVNYDIINDLFHASIDNSSIFFATGTGINSALGKLLKVVESFYG